jgi:histidinol-phosphate/aromatic aminotransferase/cobyric acid decarboxylase-like protein
MGVDPASILDLSASLNPLAPDVAGLAVRHVGSLRAYPDAGEARDLLAAAIGVAPEGLLLTNGGAEAIALLGQEIGGRVEEPEFSLHPRGEGRAPLWRSNPHNPTGLLARPDAVADVWDEAFYPLATGAWTRGDIPGGATAVVGSLTKLFACAGLRLGYVLAEPDLIARLQARQPAWSVGGLALALMPDLLHGADLVGWANGVAELRLSLTAVLDEYGLHPRPSDANFVLCDGPDGFRERLLSHGIVVRDCASFGLPDLVRIAVPAHEGIHRLARALDAIRL